MVKKKLPHILVEKIPGVGSIYEDPNRGSMLYLRFGYHGKDLNRSLGVTSPNSARRKAPGMRRDIERELILKEEQKPVAASQADPSQSRVQDELYSTLDQGGREGFFATHYPEGSNQNTRYDAEKVLRFWFLQMEKGMKLDAGSLTMVHLSRQTLTNCWNRLACSLKYKNKIYIGLNKFIAWEVDTKRIQEGDYLKDIINKVPTRGDLFSDRQEKLKDEKWTDEELKSILEACKDLTTPHVHKFDYELFYLMRYMGLPPVDAVTLKHEDFENTDDGIVFRKMRTKVNTARYFQPLVKNKPMSPEDKEVVRIIKSRLAATKKGEYLFPQEMASTEAHLEKVQAKRKQDEKTRWVSNFSDRRARLQKHLELKVKGSKGLRATFATYWIKKGIPENVLAVWLAHAPGSPMIRLFYTEVSDGGNWKLSA